MPSAWSRKQAPRYIRVAGALLDPSQCRQGISTSRETSTSPPRLVREVSLFSSPSTDAAAFNDLKKIAVAPLECLKAGASVCPGGVLEDEAELQKMLQIEDAEQLEQADDSLSDDDVEGLPIC